MSLVALGSALLVSSSGAPLAPEALAVAAVALDQAQLVAARKMAFARGRVLEREGLSLLGLGVAAQVELPSGLAGEGASRSPSPLAAYPLTARRRRALFCQW